MDKQGNVSRKYGKFQRIIRCDIAMKQTIAVEFISRCFRHACSLFWQLALAKQDKVSIQRLLKTKDNLVVFLWIREVLMIDSTNLVSVS